MPRAAPHEGTPGHSRACHLLSAARAAPPPHSSCRALPRPQPVPLDHSLGPHCNSPLTIQHFSTRPGAHSLLCLQPALQRVSTSLHALLWAPGRSRRRTPRTRSWQVLIHVGNPSGCCTLGALPLPTPVTKARTSCRRALRRCRACAVASCCSCRRSDSAIAGPSPAPSSSSSDDKPTYCSKSNGSRCLMLSMLKKRPSLSCIVNERFWRGAVLFPSGS